jgi:serine/threonine protein kinase
MELVQGQTLAERCRQYWLPVHEVVSIGVALAETLAYVHARGIVHRDVKPSNVLLGDDQRVRLADFGIARLLESTVRHTDTGVTIGTAAFLAPEQVRGEAITSACDIYALGLVLLEALTGRTAYSGSVHEVALARLTRPPLIGHDLPALPRPRTRLLSAIAVTAATVAALIAAAPLIGAHQEEGSALLTPRTSPSAEVSTSATPAAQPHVASAAMHTGHAGVPTIGKRQAARGAGPAGPGSRTAPGPGPVPAEGPGSGPAAAAAARIPGAKNPTGAVCAPGQLTTIGK